MNIGTEFKQKLVDFNSLFEVEQEILKFVMQLAQEIMREFLESLDKTLMLEAPNDHRVINRQERTINCAFGPVTFKRRYYQINEQEKKFYLDEKLSVKARRRFSPYYLMMMAKIAQTTTMRNTADVLNTLFDSGVTANTVMCAVHELGEKVGKYTQEKEQVVDTKRAPINLTIEGDAFMIKLKGTNKQPARTTSVNHYRIYERRAGEVINKRDFLSLGDLKQLEARVSIFLDTHYKLNGQTVFLASDAGPGFEPNRLKELLPPTAHGEYFLDRYHCLQKIETTLGRENELTPRALKAIREYNANDLKLVLDTYESFDLTEKQREALERLR